MAVFHRKSFSSDTTLSDKLLQARQQRGLEIHECAQQLDIQEKYLTALELSDFDSLPGEAYARHWIRQYAEFLALDPKQCLALYNAEKNISTKLHEDPEPRKRVRLREILNSLMHPQSLRVIGITAAGVLIVGYITYFIFSTFQPPTVTFDTPLVDQQTQESSITITGSTDVGSQLWFNDQPVIVDATGNFSQKIPLSDGLNIVTIHAKKKHSRTFEHTVQIVKITLPDLIN